MRYLTFKAIAKRCPKGHWKDEKSGRCVPIEEWKKLNYKYLQENGSKENSGRCPKGKWKDPKTGECVSQEEWKKRNYKNYNPKNEPDTDSKEEKKPEVEPYEDGIAKPESLKYVMGVTRKEILKDHPEYFEQVESTAKSVRDKLNDDSVWSDDTHTTAWKIKETLAPFDEYGGIEVSDNLKNIPAPVIKSILNDFVDTFEEYPYAMASFGGFTTVNENSDALMWCSYGEDRQIGIKLSEYSSMEKNDEDCESPYPLYDPVERGSERTMWGYHFKGSTAHSSISHEWGHACDIALFSMRVRSIKKERNRPIPNSIYDQSLLNNLDVNSDMGSQIRSDFAEMGYRFRATKPYGKNYGEATISLDGAEEYDMEEIKGYLKNKGYKMQEVKKYWGEIECKLVPLEETLPFNLDKLEYSDRKELRTKSRIASRQSKSLWKEMDNYSKRRVKECEELYKELYNTEILPSECYTRYGYYGAGRPARAYFSEEKANLTESASQERLAEAMEDVMVRKDKANSMSQLLVAHIEYEYYQLITGKYDLSFKDFIKNEVGLDKFKERIIKSSAKYLLFNSIAKRCPPGYHKTNDGCRRLIDGEPTGELYSQSQQAQASNPKKPKKEDKVFDEKINQLVSPDSREGKIVLAMKDGKGEDAVKSRMDYINLANELGYYPVVMPIEKKFKSYGQTFDGTRTTYDVFVNEDGEYTEARRKLHDRIIAQYLNKMKRKNSDKQIVMFLGGGSASGKGSMDEALMKDFGVDSADELEAFKIDPDAIMELLPEYKHYPPELRAPACHREASDIAEELFYVALRNNVSFIYDGTFSSEKPVKFAKSVDKDKYKMLYRGIVADPDGCVFFSNKRFVGGGSSGTARFVPESIIRSTNKGARDIRKQYIDGTDLFDDVKTFEESESRKKYYQDNKDKFFKSK